VKLMGNDNGQFRVTTNGVIEYLTSLGLSRVD
jgi:hypothetical protein